jgi:sec-independent protein translocase protein TatC
MGLLFEFPIVVMVLTKIGMVTPHFLTSHRKHAVVAIWIISAVITPSPDPINQAIVAVPLMIFYEISILVSKHVYRKKQKAIESITS